MKLAAFNAVDPDAATVQLENCCAASRWIARMRRRRPFADREAVLDAAREIWALMEEPDWLEAFAAHPRIGDIDSLREQYAATREMAGGEQQAVRVADMETLEELARLNNEYQARFGFIFIVFASGRQAAEMLALLRARINNTREQELRNAAAEQLRITLLRLDRLLR